MDINVAVLTISDRAFVGDRVDASGPAIVEFINNHHWNIIETKVVPDELREIAKVLIDWADDKRVDLILTTGGTGFSARDVTPEATLSVIQKNVPGLAEAMRIESSRINLNAMLSRGITGIRGSTLIVNLPGSPKGAIENLGVILPVLSHAIQLLREDPSAESGHRAN